MQSTDPTAEHAAIDRLTLLCFSHLRWDFVYQRPQHLLSRAQAHADVVFIEEPVFADVSQPVMRTSSQPGGLQVVVPTLPRESAQAGVPATLRALLDDWLRKRGVVRLIAWYYTPMALLFTDHLRPELVIYDCMDQLSAFDGAPPELVAQERRLFARADVVFTGGMSLYEEKKGQHRNVLAFPSSVDREHFAASRTPQIEPEDQRAIPHPRIGFFGVIDERLDQDLLREIAACEPTWHFILIGPIVKIREDALPRAENIHYMGQKKYGELPSYLAHWDVAMLPFAQNASTRFISPTKTPEYLAAGKPVVSTPIRDVVAPYGDLGLARIASNQKEFCTAIRELLAEPEGERLVAVDDFLRHTSWDNTFSGMWNEVVRLAVTKSNTRHGEGIVDV